MYINVKDPKTVGSFQVRHSLKEQLISISWGAENELLINLLEINSIHFLYSEERGEWIKVEGDVEKEIYHVADEIYIDYSNSNFCFSFVVDNWTDEERRKIKDLFLKIRSTFIHFKQELNPSIEELNKNFGIPTKKD
jgi:hypothetical protein